MCKCQLTVIVKIVRFSTKFADGGERAVTC
jgi:hypothetical protein